MVDAIILWPVAAVVAEAAYVYTAHGRTAVCARARVYIICVVRGISFASDHRNIVDWPRRILLVHSGGGGGGGTSE